MYSTKYFWVGFQSGFRIHHNTGTELFKVVNDIRINTDSNKQSVLLYQLDLSAVFVLALVYIFKKNKKKHCTLIDNMHHPASWVTKIKHTNTVARLLLMLGL